MFAYCGRGDSCGEEGGGFKCDLSMYALVEGCESVVGYSEQNLEYREFPNTTQF